MKKTSEAQSKESEIENQEMKKKESRQPIDTQSLSDNQIDQIIVQLHDEKQKNSDLRQANEQLLVQIEEKDKKLKDLNEQTAQKEVDSQTAQKEILQQAEEENPLPNKQQEELIQQIQTMSILLDSRMKELIDDRKELLKKLDDKNSRFDELVSRVQEDRYRKDKVKILRRNINMRNLVNSVLEEYRQENPRMDGHDAPAAMFLEQQLEKIIEKLDADLRQEMLIPFVKGVDGTDFDAEYQEIVERQPTDCLELDGKVYRSVAPGYVWTLPYIFKPRVNETGEEIYTYKFLLRSEDVITYKYEKKEQ